MTAQNSPVDSLGTSAAPDTDQRPNPTSETPPAAPGAGERPTNELGLPLHRDGRNRPTRNRLAVSLPTTIAAIMRNSGRAISDVAAAAIAEDQTPPPLQRFPDGRSFTKVYVTDEHHAVLKSWVEHYANLGQKVSMSELIAVAVDRWYAKRSG